MRSHCPRLAALALTAVAATTHAADDDWKIVADIHPELPFKDREVPLHPAPGGLALARIDGRWRLAPATLAATVAGSDENGRPQPVTVAAMPANALAYLRLRNLRPGPLEMPGVSFEGPDRDLEAGTVSLPFRHKPWRFEASADAVWFTDGVRRQKIDDRSALDNPTYPVSLGLAWAGDLDRDGRLDFVTRMTGDDGTTTCVWLSSAATRHQLVGKAACFDRLY